MAQEATPAPARHVPPRVQEMRASFSSSCLLGEAGGERESPAPCARPSLWAPGCTGLAPPPALLPSSRCGPPRASACTGSPGRGQASCPGSPSPTLPGALTAEVRAPPVLRLPPLVGALAGVLSEGGTGAGGAAAQVLGAGGYVHLGVHQPVTGSEGGAQQGAAADALLGDRTDGGCVLPEGLCGDPSSAASPRPGSPLPRGPFQSASHLSSLTVHPLILPSAHLSFHCPVCPSRPSSSRPAAHLPPHPSQP